MRMFSIDPDFDNFIGIYVYFIYICIVMCQYILLSLLSLLLLVVLFIFIIYYYYCYYYYHYYYHYYYYILMFRCPSFFVAVIDFESMGYCQLAKLGHERSK
jgi:hypothetical protein